MHLLPLDTYLASIANSVGSKAYRSVYGLVEGKRKDLTQRGTLSCAYFVSSILKQANLLTEIHLTVDGTVREMRRRGWRTVSATRPKPGTVLVWGAVQYSDGPHKHIGFSLGGDRAVSTSYRTRTVQRHHRSYHGKRPVVAAFWHPSLARH